jgi:hypothetical protein
LTTIHTIARPLAIRPHDPPAERALGAVALVFLVNSVVLSSPGGAIVAVLAATIGLLAPALGRHDETAPRAKPTRAA